MTLSEVLAAAVRHYEQSYAGLRVHGPADLAGDQGAPSRDDVQAFAASYALQFAPYLDNAFHREVDAALDSVSPGATFVASWHGEVVGTLRARMGAHEFPYMADVLRSVSHLVDGFAEYGRLMVRGDHRSLGVGRLLVAQATRWAVAETSAPGIVALCRPETAMVFRQYGLRPMLRNVVVAERDNGIYELIAGSWTNIRDQLTRRPPRETLRPRASGAA